MSYDIGIFDVILTNKECYTDLWSYNIMFKNTYCIKYYLNTIIYVYDTLKYICST